MLCVVLLSVEVVGGMMSGGTSKSRAQLDRLGNFMFYKPICRCFELKNTSDYRFKYNFNINRISYFAGCQVFKDELLDFYVP